MSSAVFALACSAGTLGPAPEALIVIDTNLPSPRVISSVRFDVYKSDGTWFESRSEDNLTAKNFPLSFSVAGSTSVSTTVMVRIRAFANGALRNYTGNHFQPWPDTVASPQAGDGLPRLIVGGADVTPLTEPLPELTVDRVVNVTIAPNQHGRAVVRLDGACVGHMAELAPAWTSCHAADAMRVREEPATLDADMNRRPTSMVGSIGQSTCPPAPKGHVAPCVTGGAFILGPSTAGEPAMPKGRAVVVPTFRMMSTEVTVAQMRTAITADGFHPGDGSMGVGTVPLPPDDPNEACTMTYAPGPRESFALSCIKYDPARRYCNHYGGDLPTEVEWEFAATSADRDSKTQYPWGDTPPKCTDAIFGRASLSGVPGACAQEMGYGPIAIVDDNGLALAAVDTTPQGILHLAGGLTEWTRDAVAPWDDRCWLDAPTISPSCAPADATKKMRLRGGSWASPNGTLVSTTRLEGPQTAANGGVGFRCVFR